MNLAKKIILIILGILISLIVSEIVLRIFQPEILKSNPVEKENKDFFEWAYLDIHKPFFKTDKDEFYIQREDFWIPKKNDKKYKYNKENGTKRILILGESTAKNYPEEILEQKLLKYFKCEVINCGIGAYDSYRIEKVSKELSLLNPDWVICFIGNNDKVIEDKFSHIPFYFNPIDINYLPYKYSFIKKYLVLNLLSYIFNREIKFETQDKIEKFFKKNIIKIIKNLKNTKLIFIDLPNNKDFYYCSINIYDIIQMGNKDFIVWKDTNYYRTLLKRLEFIENLQKKYNNIFYTNLTDTLLDYCNNLSYNIFEDNCHWTQTTYELLSEIISKIIVKQDFNKDIKTEMSKEDFNKKIINDDRELSDYGIIDYFIKNHFDYAYRYYTSKKESFKENISNERIYNNIYIYAYCLYKNNYKDLSLNILNELISLQPNYIEAYITLGYIYYKENDMKKAEEYFNIATKLKPDNKINVEYLKHLKEEKN